MILETTARRGTPLRIGVVSPVVVELRPTVIEPQVRHIARVIAGAAGSLPISIRATEDRALLPAGNGPICSFS